MCASPENNAVPCSSRQAAGGRSTLSVADASGTGVGAFSIVCSSHCFDSTPSVPESETRSNSLLGRLCEWWRSTSDLAVDKTVIIADASLLRAASVRDTDKVGGLSGSRATASTCSLVVSRCPVQIATDAFGLEPGDPAKGLASAHDRDGRSWSSPLHNGLFPAGARGSTGPVPRTPRSAQT